MPVRVSGAFISFNHSKYVQAALTSALGQDYPMQLIISDDFSTDDTAAKIDSVLRHYSGHHDVLFRSASKNLGVCGNQNLVFSRAEGELVVVFEGDDISVPTRVSQLTAAYISNDRRVSALGSSVIRI